MEKLEVSSALDTHGALNADTQSFRNSCVMHQ